MTIIVLTIFALFFVPIMLGGRQYEAYLSDHKNKNNFYVIEGFAVSFCSVLSFSTLAAVLCYKVPFVPIITMASLAAVIAHVLTIFYLICRTRCTPEIAIRSKTFLYSALGMVIVWFNYLWLSHIFPGKSTPVIELIKCKDVYKYINIACFVLLGPITEEFIYRGYFVKLLLPRGRLNALAITSVLFVAMHLVSRNYNSNFAMIVYGVYFFIFSMAVGFIYTRSGLVSAILIHIFANLYVLVVNT